jgi:Holliday junction DNA helicase RuvA
MYGYIKGIIKEIESNYVIIDNHDIGYIIYVPNPYYYKENETYTIYTYTHIREDEYSLYGFSNKEQLNLFLKLIQVKGVGPKMALPMLATGSPEGIYDAIERENILYLKKFPKIGEKVARQIILDLKGKVNGTQMSLLDSKNSNELIEALLALGYKQADVKKIITNVNMNLTIEEQIKEALKLLLK